MEVIKWITIAKFLSLFNERIYPIAESNFANTIEFYCQTFFYRWTYLKNSVINCNTDQKINNKLQFKNLSELEI